MNDADQLIKWLGKKEKMVAMLAPSFPVVYSYPQIVGRLKRLGFAYVVEVSVGAEETNREVIELLKKSSQVRLITSPCPTLVRMIRNKYPHLKKYLALEADSPMIAMARIVKEKYPDHRLVFVGPCLMKKKEASEDYPELNLLVVTYKEMDQVLAHFQIEGEIEDQQARFDIEEEDTRLYPISGGLTHSSGMEKILSSDQIEVVSGVENCMEAIARFEKNKDIRLLDVLFCDGGCVSGPGIDSQLNLDQRRQKVVDFWEREEKSS